MMKSIGYFEIIGRRPRGKDYEAARKTLPEGALAFLRNDRGQITRESAALWLTENERVFYEIADFALFMGGSDDPIIDWQDGESAAEYAMLFE